jgi:hypothetical protein
MAMVTSAPSGTVSVRHRHESETGAVRRRTVSFLSLTELAAKGRGLESHSSPGTSFAPRGRVIRVKTVKPFTRLAIVVLWLIALPQLLLFIAKREITLNGGPVPLWLSVLVAALAASLAAMVWWEQTRQK